MEAILGPLFPLTFLAFFVAERFLRGAPMPPVRRWAAKGLGFFVLGLTMNALLPGPLAALLAPVVPLDLSGLGILGGAAVTFLAASFVDYWLHRSMHTVPLLWRWAHQMHHSAERVDMAGFGYTHPNELILAVTLSTLVGTLLGAAPEGVMLAGYVSFVVGLVQHFNVRTPAWLGWIIQRPEAHRLHHTRGIHAYNYGLPLWDAIFGTRRNPAAWEAEYGFWDGASAEVGAMLVGRDVAEPPPRAPEAARAAP